MLEPKKWVKVKEFDGKKRATEILAQAIEKYKISWVFRFRSKSGMTN